MTDVVVGFDPRTGRPRARVPVTGIAETERLLDAAAGAADAWASTPRSDRAALLRRVADGLERDAARIVSTADAETALGTPRLEGELGRTTGQLRMFASDIESGHHLQVLLTPADPEAGVPDLRRMRIPRGPVVVFAASNFPLAFSVAGGDTASALAAGCPVVVKAHENHPRTSELVAAVLTSVLPDGVFGVCHGRQAGLRAVAHPAATAVGFTGSLAGGLALAEECRRRPVPIPFFGELASLNPVVVMPDVAAADGERVAREFVASMTLGNGQFCTKPGLLFVPDDGLMPRLVATAVRRAVTGPLLTPGIRESYVGHEGHRRLTLLATGTGDPEIPMAVAPELRLVRSEDFDLSLAHLSAERFGPAAVVATYTSQQDLLDKLARLPGSLTAAVHSIATGSEVRSVAAVLQRRAGRLILNGWPTGVAVRLAQHHGGPFPATTDAAATSVGSAAIDRWLVPMAFQGWPEELLPPELQHANPMRVPRRVEPTVPS
ncbi:aldehyde dehydrogenase family protein [Nocardioides sp. LHD-245]|uniref:aldehyde dehydrogenase family protein n=1 Tax=Nocardioides sp. LHD-245 TaxID=3051387 RepID=UPI0027DF611C|nr:aldehyde dehydrogenase family protein [Nocardioides sp. LHD-245]